MIERIIALILLCLMVVFLGYWLGKEVQDGFDDFNWPDGYL